jgi:hypothetical protein
MRWIEGRSAVRGRWFEVSQGVWRSGVNFLVLEWCSTGCCAKHVVDYCYSLLGRNG